MWVESYHFDCLLEKNHAFSPCSSADLRPGNELIRSTCSLRRRMRSTLTKLWRRNLRCAGGRNKRFTRSESGLASAPSSTHSSKQKSKLRVIRRSSNWLFSKKGNGTETGRRLFSEKGNGITAVLVRRGCRSHPYRIVNRRHDTCLASESLDARTAAAWDIMQFALSAAMMNARARTTTLHHQEVVVEVWLGRLGEQQALATYFAVSTSPLSASHFHERVLL